MTVEASELTINPRFSIDRGNADHGWLKTFHTFSFAGYQSATHQKYGPLRVINEDRVQAHTGFGTHSHREFEIFSYVVSGEIKHNDSMGNVEILKRGDIQMTSAGTGISHSEHANGDSDIHFLQIWALPRVARLKPAYYTRHFTDAEKKDKWALVVAPIDDPSAKTEREAEGPTPVQAALRLNAALISPGVTLPHITPNGLTKQYIHVIQTSGFNQGPAKGASVVVRGKGGKEQVLREGDGAYLVTEDGKKIEVENVGEGVAEVLLFDLGN